MTTNPNELSLISGIDPGFTSLAAATATGVGNDAAFSRPRDRISMQVSFTGGSPTVKVQLEGTINGTNWFILATFDTGASGANGDIVTSSTHVVLKARANLVTLSGGSSPTVTAVIVGGVYS
jgi:hypothetical protein